MHEHEVKSEREVVGFLWTRFVRYALLASLLISGAVVVVDPATARNSQLSQEIIPVGCDHDTYQAGIGQVHHVACPYFAPVISFYERTPEGGFMVYGAYDSVHTMTDPITNQHQLSITFGGKTFTLGIDPELTVDGNAWVLDLSDWRDIDPDPDPDVDPDPGTGPPTHGGRPRPKPGASVGTQVTTTMKPDGNGVQQSLSGTAVITVPNYPIDKSSLPGCKNDTKKGWDCKRSGDIWPNLWLLAGLSAIVALETLFLLLIGLKRRRKDNDEGLSAKE